MTEYTVEGIGGFTPNTRELFARALRHKSVSKDNNELLEFLGDAVLELIVSRELYARFAASHSEGELTLTRAALVNTQSLADAAERTHIADIVAYNRAIVDEKARRAIFADAFEAFVGAVYLDQGLECAATFVENHILTGASAVLEGKTYKDAKTLLQELTQRDMGVTPEYAILKEEGPEHKKTFAAGVYLKGELFASGTGTSKQEAETRAAEEALRLLQDNHSS